MYYTVGLEETEEFKKFLKMSPEEFDEYMCKTYPSLFDQRKLPMSQTCMCWGFNIGRGWYYYLDELCRKLDLIEKATGLHISFVQIKEKFAGGRFYYNIQGSKCKLSEEEIKHWSEIISELISNAESRVESVCEETGKHINSPINIGCWVYALSEEGYLKQFPERKESLETWKKEKEEEEKIQEAISNITKDEDIEKLKEFLKIK